MFTGCHTPLALLLDIFEHILLNFESSKFYIFEFHFVHLQSNSQVDSSHNGGTSFVLGRFESNKIHSVKHVKIKDVLAAFVPMGSGLVVGGVFVSRSPIDFTLTQHRVSALTE